MLSRLPEINNKVLYIALATLFLFSVILFFGYRNSSHNQDILLQDIVSRDNYLFPSDSEFWRGSKLADIVVVEYTDFDCPFCSKAEKDMGKLFALNKEKEGTVALVLRHYPLVYLHKNAYKKAVAFECLRKEYDPNLLTSLFFARQEQSPAEIIATVTGGDAEKKRAMLSCLDDVSVHSIVDEAMAKAAIAGVKSTPTFVIYKNRRQVASFSGSSIDRLVAITTSILSNSKTE